MRDKWIVVYIHFCIKIPMSSTITSWNILHCVVVARLTFLENCFRQSWLMWCPRVNIEQVPNSKKWKYRNLKWFSVWKLPKHRILNIWELFFMFLSEICQLKKYNFSLKYNYTNKFRTFIFTALRDAKF